ncbi:MAG: AsmA family protein [Acidobacteriota bacterium]
MTRRRRRLLILAGVALALLVAVAVVVPYLVDVNHYRGTIESAARDALGREVHLGEMRLAILPRLGISVQDLSVGALPEEGGGDLLTAKRVRIGVRFLPLLEKRLEVTRVVLEEPSMVLAREADRSWNIQQLVASGGGKPAGEQGSGGPEAFSVDHLAVRGGRITLRDRGLVKGKTLEAVLTDLNLDIADLALDQVVSVDIAATLAGERPMSVKLQGKVGPLRRAQGVPLRLEGQLALDQLDPGRLAPWINGWVGPGWAPPGGVLGQRPFSLSGELDAAFGTDATGSPTLDHLALSQVQVDHLEAHLRRDRAGALNLPSFGTASEKGGSAAGPALPLQLSDLEITDLGLHWMDAFVSRPAHQVNLEVTRLALDHLPTRAKAAITAEMKLSGKAGRGSVSVQGQMGPWITADGSHPADLTLHLDALPLAVTSPYTREFLAVDPVTGTLTSHVKIKGNLSGRFSVTGDLDLDTARVHLNTEATGSRTVDLDLASRFDVGITGGGAVFDLRAFQISIGGHTMDLQGRIDRSGALPVVDLKLLPATFAADDLTRLLALADYALPVTFSAGRPLEIEARVRGPLGGAQYLEIDGHLKVEAFTFQHAVMPRPMRDISGTVRVSGDTVAVEDFRGLLGSSDVAGDLTVTGFESPRVTFNVHSRHADFWELMSFAGTGSSATSPSEPAPAGASGSLLEKVTAQGNLAIDQGSFQKLAFRGLQAGLRLAGQRMTLDPFHMSLYQGDFDGTATLDLGKNPPAFRITAQVENVETGPLLDENLGLEGLFSGRFTGSVEARGQGAGYEDIVRSLSGGGKVEVADGKIGKLDVLGMLSKVTGIFGEQSLNTLSRKLQEEGTSFTSLSGTLQLNGPQMSSQDLRLESPDMTLEGKARVDLLSSAINGDLQILFSPELSRSMREEKSRAASAFWDAKRDQVHLPLTLSGSLDAPAPGIDWGSAAGQLVSRKAEETLRKKLGSRLGGLLGRKVETPEPSPAPEPTAVPEESPSSSLAPAGSAEAAASAAAPAPPPPAAATLTATITRVHWSGSFLAKDLTLEGQIQGRNLASASLEVTDAKGRSVTRVASLPEVARYVSSGVDPSLEGSVPWKVKVSGKRLLLAKPPFTVTVTAVDRQGQTAEIRQEVRRR